MLRGTSRITPKLAGIRWYVNPILCWFALNLKYTKQTRRGVFQSDPILETLLSYYSSSSIMEEIPTEDPGPGN